jgi:tRNA (guanine-N7-)-methyltransferase
LSKKNKLQHFAENLTFDNLFQLRFEEVVHGFFLKGKWANDFFKNENDIVLELGCGKGEYTVGLASRHPEKNFVGADIKGARLWRGLKTCQEENLKNVAFVRTRINLIDMYFDKAEVSEIWITFPDPHPRGVDERRRLTSPAFLKKYHTILKSGGTINLKTDNIIFLEYTLDVLREQNHEILELNYDVYGSGFDNELTQIQTHYEKRWLKHGTKIKYLKFRLNYPQP